MNNVMKINILLKGFLALMLFCSCGDNDEAFPSHMEKNWYVIEYDPNASELDRLIFEVYDRTGFPIFYSDTIGSQTRYDKGGNPYTYYEVFKPGYIFTNRTTAPVYSIERDGNRLRQMVELLDEYVLEPYFSKERVSLDQGKYGPLAFLFVDTLLTGSGKKADSLYLDLGVLVLSTRYTCTRGTNKFISVSEMTEAEKVKYGWNLAIYELLRYFQNSYPDEISAYFDMTKENPDLEGYNYDLFEIAKINKSYNYVTGLKGYDFDLNEPRKYGVLLYKKYDKYSVYFPTFLEDLSSFINMIYTKTDAEIRVENGEYELLIKRYEALVKLLKKSGLIQFIKG